MAKYCGKCGNRLDEKTGLCPRCGTDENDSNSKRKKIKRKWLAFLPISVMIVVLGGVFVLSYFRVVPLPAFDSLLKAMGLDDASQLKRYFYSFSAEYTVLEENDDGTFLLSVEAPDFSKIIIEETEEFPEGSAKEIDRATLAQMVEDHPGDVTVYEFEVPTLDSKEIQVKFFDTVTHKMLAGTISNTAPLTGLADGGDNS